MPSIALNVGDFIMMGAGLGAMLLMMLLGQGKTDETDLEGKRRSIEAFLNSAQRHRSPVLTLAMMAGLCAVAYALIFLYYKAL